MLPTTLLGSFCLGFGAGSLATLATIAWALWCEARGRAEGRRICDEIHADAMARMAESDTVLRDVDGNLV